MSPFEQFIHSILTPGGIALLGALFGFLSFIAMQAWRIARYTQRTEEAITQMWTRADQTKWAYQLQVENDKLKVPIPDETPRPRWPKKGGAVA